MSDSPSNQLRRQCQWFGRLGVSLDVAVRRANGQFVARHGNMDAADIAPLGRWLRAENAHGADVFVRPHRYAEVPLVFLDDVPTPDALSLARQVQSLVVETSPGRCHLWLATDRALGESSRQRMQQALAAGQIIPGLHADPASTSGEHYGRFAGFRNCKPQRGCWVNLLAASVEYPVLRVGAAPLGDAEGAAGKALMGQQLGGGRDPLVVSESERDWAWVMRELEQGGEVQRIESELVNRCRPRRGPDAQRYAARTVAQAKRRIAARIAGRRWSQ